MDDYKKVLDLPMTENDANAKDIRGYLKSLLSELWVEEEGFSGKRPFGNSGWQGDIEKALVVGGVCKGKIDSDGYLESVDQDRAKVLVLGAISSL